MGHHKVWCKHVAAPRYAGVDYDAYDLDITLGEIPLMKKGQPLEFDAKAASKYLTETSAVHGTVYITISLGSGSGKGIAWVGPFWGQKWTRLGVCVCKGGGCLPWHNNFFRRTELHR